ncbi:unnamed protein product [Rangifer tarandus platyrhynchus]|uniref:Uncharacterized protein n=2 Tax=Rangifer tarandus platyrhynchus TaxID=3082113 RepID=A0ACB0FD22_RANTA|nr:unnamed protein product [Rangifer tarandus platyrhynchus]CAI9710980.1 unnamed protein product [Rangifer tarandus platyrhynchus]
MRRGAGAARALGPGKDGGRGAPPRAAAATACARAGGAAQGEGTLLRCPPAGACPGPIPRSPDPRSSQCAPAARAAPAGEDVPGLPPPARSVPGCPEEGRGAARLTSQFVAESGGGRHR